MSLLIINDKCARISIFFNFKETSQNGNDMVVEFQKEAEDAVFINAELKTAHSIHYRLMGYAIQRRRR